MLTGIGTEGQARLRAAHVAILGMGALGCALADQIARAGVGMLTLIDRDVVEWTNLQRQCLYSEADAVAGLAKVDAAVARLHAINAEVVLRPRAADATHANIEMLLGFGESDVQRPAVLLDGTDNFATRYLLNDVAIKHGVAYCYAGVVASQGTQATFVPNVTACLRCLLPSPPSPGDTLTCDTAGVLGPAVHIVASAQVADAIKIITGNVGMLSGSLVSFDIWNNLRRRIALPAPDPLCPCCGLRRFSYLEGTGTLDDAAQICGQETVQVWNQAAIDLEVLAHRLGPLGIIQRTRAMLRFDPADAPAIRLTIFPDGRALIKGTKDPARARTLYARYLGG